MKLRCCHENRPPACCPPGPPPVPEDRPDFFAQFGVYGSPESGSSLPFIQLFKEGEGIRLDGDTDILLGPGWLYLVNYLFLATPEPDGFMQIIPRINGSLRGLYSFFAPTGAEKNTSAAGSFTTNEAAASEARLSFHLTYPSTTRNIDISGAVSVTPLIRIKNSGS